MCSFPPNCSSFWIFALYVLRESNTLWDEELELTNFRYRCCYFFEILIFAHIIGWYWQKTMFSSQHYCKIFEKLQNSFFVLFYCNAMEWWFLFQPMRSYLRKGGRSTIFCLFWRRALRTAGFESMRRMD